MDKWWTGRKNSRSSHEKVIHLWMHISIKSHPAENGLLVLERVVDTDVRLSDLQMLLSTFIWFYILILIIYNLGGWYWCPPLRPAIANLAHHNWLSLCRGEVNSFNVIFQYFQVCLQASWGRIRIDPQWNPSIKHN